MKQLMAVDRELVVSLEFRFLGPRKKRRGPGKELQMQTGAGGRFVREGKEGLQLSPGPAAVRAARAQGQQGAPAP